MAQTLEDSITSNAFLHSVKMQMGISQGHQGKSGNLKLPTYHSGHAGNPAQSLLLQERPSTAISSEEGEIQGNTVQSIPRKNPLFKEQKERDRKTYSAGLEVKKFVCRWGWQEREG